MTTVKKKNSAPPHANVIRLFLFLIATGFATLATANSDAPLPRVLIETSEGNMELALRPDVAPETVENFLAYASSGFYNDTIFHRVIPGFMIQGGGFDESLTRQQTRDPVRNEATPTLKNLRGTIAMARTNDPDSATSQFFINLVDNHFLNAGVRGPGYTVFGRVTEGMGVADAIAGKATGYRNGMADVPVQPIIIHRISRIEPQAE